MREGERKRGGEGVCEATNCVINGGPARRAPAPTTRKHYVKQTAAHVIPGTWFSCFSTWDGGREERGAPLRLTFFHKRDVLPIWGYTRAFRILYGLGPGMGNGNWINEESVRYICTLYN